MLDIVCGYTVLSGKMPGNASQWDQSQDMVLVLKMF